MQSSIVYFIQPAELLGTDRYKIGKSNCNNIARVKKGYKKGTRYIYIMECQNNGELEKKLIQAFKTNFELVAGAEYFSGNELKMKNLFMEIYHNHITNEDLINPETEDSNLPAYVLERRSQPYLCRWNAINWYKDGKIYDAETDEEFTIDTVPKHVKDYFQLEETKELNITSAINVIENKFDEINKKEQQKLIKICCKFQKINENEIKRKEKECKMQNEYFKRRQKRYLKVWRYSDKYCQTDEGGWGPKLLYYNIKEQLDAIPEVVKCWFGIEEPTEFLNKATQEQIDIVKCLKAEDYKYQDRRRNACLQKDQPFKGYYRNSGLYYINMKKEWDYDTQSWILKTKIPKDDVPEDVKEWFGENHKFGKDSDFIKENKIYL